MTSATSPLPDAATLLEQSQHTIIILVEWIKLGVETMGAAIIAAGVVVSALLFVRLLINHTAEPFSAARLTLARYLALALEFQLGADILATAISPSWDQLGKLGAIAVIRTALNFFLMREMEREDEPRPPVPPQGESGSGASRSIR